MIEVGNFDTFSGSNGNFRSVWGAFPFFDSETIIASDIDSILWIFKPNYIRACYLEGEITNSADGSALNQVDVKINSIDANAENSAPDGTYKTGQVTAGIFDVTFSKSGFLPQTVNASLQNGEVTILNIALQRDTSVTTSLQELQGVEQLFSLSLIHISEPTRPY